MIKEISPKQYVKILDSYNGREYLYRGKYYLIRGNKYIGVDNSTGDCWVEEFDTLDECIDWLDRKFEVQDEINQ